MVNNIHTTKKNKAAVLLTNQVVHSEANNKRNEKIPIYHYDDAEQNLNIQTGNKSFENVANFKYYGKTLSNKNCMHQHIK